MKGGLKESGSLPSLSQSSRAGKVNAHHAQIEGIQRERALLEEQKRGVQSRLGKIEKLQNNTEEYIQLVELKRERKKLEVDAQMLSNRIELLKKEEMKIWKRIRELYNEAEKIEMYKKKNKVWKEEKEHVMKLINAKHSNKGVNGIKKKEELDERRELAKEVDLIKKKRRTEKIKIERKINEKKFEKMKVDLIKNNKKKKKAVITNIKLGSLKKQYYIINKQKNVLNRLKQEKSHEKLMIQKVKRELNNLWKQEEDWMSKVKDSQKMQNQAFDKLKTALAIKDQEGEEGDMDELENGSYQDDADEDLSEEDPSRAREGKEIESFSKGSLSDEEVSVE